MILRFLFFLAPLLSGLPLLGRLSAQDDLSLRGLDKLDFRSVVKSAKEKVFPAVVFIKCLREDMQGGRRVSQEVSGSGVLISAEGELLSNWHVVDKATEVRCLLSNGKAYDAKGTRFRQGYRCCLT